MAAPYEISDVPTDWDPDERCCLECGNDEPLVSLVAVLGPTQCALSCTRHVDQVAAALR
ncbi:hypothetical protein [Streptomyces tendae]|uniref:hypothetical protein n=1 Tax=Streptomyces tendae TaxID=1932 RepID=UPI003EBA0986